ATVPPTAALRRPKKASSKSSLLESSVLHQACIAKCDGQPGYNFGDVLLEWNINEALQVGENLDFSLAQHYYSRAPELGHKPAELEDDVLPGSPERIGRSHSNHEVVRGEQRKREGAEWGVIFELLDDCHAAFALLSQHDRFETKTAQEIGQLRPRGFA